MKPTFSIGERPVGPGAPVFIIAEAGVSHFGDIGLARELVDLAAESGADAFKTQFFDVDALIARRAAEWRDRLRPRNLTFDQALELKERCDARKILFMSTAHDATRIDWLARLDVPAIKVGSGERNNPGFLTALARLGRPMIVSTGMYSEVDVMEAIAACHRGGCDRLALLHCVTSYPTPLEQVNLRAVDRLREMFAGPVGYSDHTDGFLAVFAAVARGACIIEKHITILRDVPNAQDWKVSAGPDNFKEMITGVRAVERMLGQPRIAIAPAEASSVTWATKSLVALRDLEVGHVLAREDLVAKRPGDGVAPNRIDEVLGRRLRRALDADDAVTLSDID